MAALLIIFCVLIPLYVIAVISAKYECKCADLNDSDKIFFSFCPPFNFVVGFMGLIKALRNFDAFEDEKNEFKENLNDLFERFIIWYEAKPKSKFCTPKEYRRSFGIILNSQNQEVASIINDSLSYDELDDLISLLNEHLGQENIIFEKYKECLHFFPIAFSVAT